MPLKPPNLYYVYGIENQDYSSFDNFTRMHTNNIQDQLNEHKPGPGRAVQCVLVCSCVGGNGSLGASCKRRRRWRCFSFLLL